MNSLIKIIEMQLKITKKQRDWLIAELRKIREQIEDRGMKSFKEEK